MKGRGGRWLLALATGAALYLVMVARLDAASLAQGLVVAALAWWLAGGGRRREEEGGAGVRHLLPHLPNLAVWQVMLGSWKVARAALGWRPIPRGAFVEVPVGEDPTVSPAALAILETLSPGTYLVDVDEERGVLLFHLFDAAEAPELRRRHAKLLAVEDGEGQETGAETGAGTRTEGASGTRNREETS